MTGLLAEALCVLPCGAHNRGSGTSWLCDILDGDGLTHVVLDHHGGPKEIRLAGRGHRPAVAAVHVVLGADVADGSAEAHPVMKVSKSLDRNAKSFNQCIECRMRPMNKVMLPPRMV